MTEPDYTAGYNNGRRDRLNGDDPGYLQVDNEPTDYGRGYWDGYALRDCKLVLIEGEG